MEFEGSDSELEILVQSGIRRVRLRVGNTVQSGIEDSELEMLIQSDGESFADMLVLAGRTQIG